MAVLVASLFLPYTIHFEVESSKVPILNEDDMAELVDTSSILSNKVGSPNPEYEPTVSIFKRLNKSSATLPTFGNSGKVYESDTASVNSVVSDTKPPSNAVSVQDFFFNNPNSTRWSLQSPPLEETSRYTDGYFRSNDHSVRSASPEKAPISAQSSTYVQPRSRVRTPQAQPMLESTHSTRSLGRVMKQRRATGQSTVESSMRSSPFPDEHAFDDSSISEEDEEEHQPRSRHDSRVVPFGGFSKDYSAFLEQSTNVFATAPWRIVPYYRGNGSLRNAVRRACSTGDVQSVRWIGTPGMPSDLVPDTTRDAIRSKLLEEYNADCIFVKDDVFEGHYDQFCKQLLWPIMQYQLPESQKKHEFISESWKSYEQVNRLFADSILAAYQEGDTIWVHDYHLMLVPGMVREKLPYAKIGFFLHVSFPSSEVFRCLPQRKQILQGMLGADSIGMQTTEYVAHFFQSCNRLLLADFDEHGVRYNNRNVSVTQHPIGIEASALDTLLDSQIVTNWRELVRDRWNDRTLIVSRDKLDKIRGVKEKLLAYERFLQNNPEYLDKVILLLICLPGRAAADDAMENEITAIAERINSRTDNLAKDRPVILLNQDLQFEQYLALLSEAGLFIVSTLREGMNLTCHEFVEASKDDYSPLILSEFVGSARVLSGGALVTNPYNISEVANAIKRSLEMDSVEKERRWKAMHAAVLRHDSRHWVQNCMAELDDAHEVNTSQQSMDIKQLDPVTLSSHLVQGKRLFLLNASDISMHLHIQGTTINPLHRGRVDTILNNLASDPRNAVYLFSYSTCADLERAYQSLVDVGMLAENGSYVRLHNTTSWTSQVNEKQLEWLPTVVETMRSFSDRVPGAYVQAETSMVRMHTENSHDIDPDHKFKLIGEVMTHINELYGHDYNIHATLVDQIVVVQRVDAIQNGLKQIIEQTGPYEFALVAGSTSSDDEDIYGYFNLENVRRREFDNNVLTVKIGKPKTSTGAEYKLRGVNELMTLLSTVD